MSQSVTIHYTPSQHDYATVLRLFFWQRTSTKISLVFLVIAFGLVAYMILSKGTSPTIFELVWLLLPPLFMIYIIFIQPSRLARQASQNERLITEATWEVSEAGLQISSRFDTTHMDWVSFKKLVTAKDYYLLLRSTNNNAFRFLPRRAFSSAEEELFLELVGKYITRG